MNLRFGKPLLILLIPVLIYGLAKGVMYFNAKRAVDDVVVAAANQADIRYQGIETDLRGAVTVRGVDIQPLGYDDSIQVDEVRMSSDDLMFFIKGGHWQPGDGEPPSSLGFDASGVRLPLSSDLAQVFTDRRDAALDAAVVADAVGPCGDNLNIEPALLKQMGFDDLVMGLDGFYRLDKQTRTLEFGMQIELEDIESIALSATLSDVDVETLAAGAPPQLNLAGFTLALRVSPEFGRQAIKSCASGTEQTLEQLSATFADNAVRQFSVQGLTLGEGLQRAVHTFYRDWGEFKVVSAPAEPIGLLSLMFLQPNQLADALSLRLSLNDSLITDTRFDWQRPDARGLGALFGEEEQLEAAPKAIAPKRVRIRREYQRIATARVVDYVDHMVRLKPQGQPMRQGVLKRIANGEAEVEQTLKGGQYTVYVPLQELESAEVLIARKLPAE